jgi:small subunit ribosomal protein S20
MPHLKSGKKRLRQNIKRREHNRATKKALKKQLKAVFEVAENKQSTVEQLKKEATSAVKKLDKAAAKRVIHPNTAARKKSQIARLINAKNKPAAAAMKK